MDQNDSTMNYGRMPVRDNMDAMSSAFQAHQSLGQALGPHMYPISPSSANPGSSSTSASPLTFVTSSSIQKRKSADGTNEQPTKRRKDNEEGADNFDVDGAAGAKHWSEEEKTRLFKWLMDEDDHWNSLRATKNSCLRECAVAIFDSKKSYQALKGCYERNFNLFRSIYACETYHTRNGLAPVNMSKSEADRLRDFDNRLQESRKAGCDVGTITARTIDSWHRLGWYTLFYQRWHGDPATTRNSTVRGTTVGASNSHGRDDGEDEETVLDFPDTSMNGINRNAINELNNITTTNRANGSLHPSNNNNMPFMTPHAYPDASQPLGPPPPMPPVPSQIPHQPSASSQPNPTEPIIQITMTQGMMQAYMQYLQVQTQTSKMKVDIMRRREEREEKESSLRREYEKLRQERDMEEYNVKLKYEKAMQILDHPGADATLKEAAGNFLKRMWN